MKTSGRGWNNKKAPRQTLQIAAHEGESGGIYFSEKWG